MPNSSVLVVEATAPPLSPQEPVYSAVTYCINSAYTHLCRPSTVFFITNTITSELKILGTENWKVITKA
jgi:hypothetical protein